MDKMTTRARRNGNPSDQSSATPGDAPVADSTVATAVEPAGRTEGERSAAQVVPNSTRGLQDTFIDERNDVMAVINELEDQLDRQQEVRETIERELTTATEQLQSANQRVQELEWQCVTLQTRVDALEQLRHDVALLEEELNDANAKTARVAEQLSASEKERTRQKAELKGLNKQLDELWTIRKERDGLRTDYKNLSTRVEELERTQRELIEERTLLQSQLQEARLTVEEITIERNQHALAARSNEDKIRELSQVQDALEEKIELLRSEKKSLQVQLTHLERENARLVDQRQFFESELTVLRNQNRTAEAALASVKKAFSEVRIALGETKSRVRRRTLDTWPRVGSMLRGIAPGATNDPAAITTPDDPELVRACAGDVDANPAVTPSEQGQ